MANLEYTIYNPITHHTIQDVDLLLSYKLIASYSLHPWFKTPKHGRAPWPFSPTVFFVPCHFHKSPGIQSQHLSGMETQLQLLRFWTECFWVQSLQAIHVYLLQPEGYREEFLLKEASPFTGQWYPTSDFSTFQQKKKLTHETDSQSKMRHCTFNTHSFVAHKLGANVNIIDLDGGADTKKMYQRLDPCTS